MTMDSIPDKDKSIIMTGFMGVGKTTVGRHLSNYLQWEFVDVDQQIEIQHGKPVTEIFKEVGEPAFRQMEKEFITALCQQSKRQVISLGGGAFLQEEIRQSCLNYGIVIYLDISWDLWKKRLPYIQDTRPILQQKSIEEIEQLFYARRNLYQDHHICIEMDELGFEEAAMEIVAKLNL